MVTRTPDFSISYPRRIVQRAAMRLLGRGLLSILTRTTVTGRENWPERGPLLVVGNHIAAIEAVLMMVYAPWQIEPIGPGDIAPPPAMDAIARMYGYTPINRGSVDRAALTKALDVLRQGGVLGIFPEGGIWDTGAKPAKRGVAWLSYHAQAPILPIGFGGLEGALNAIFRLKRPRLAMNIGAVLSPVTLDKDKSRKACFQEAAAQVMQAVYDLIPDEYKPPRAEIVDERFELQVAIYDRGQTVQPPADLSIGHAVALSKMFYRPAILRIFSKDLHRPVDALQRLETEHNPQVIAQAIQHMLDYVENENPNFFAYRFGNKEGLAMQTGLIELSALSRWAAGMGYTISIAPVRRCRLPDGQVVTESDPGQTHLW
ncbi:MAG: 1-acyl-sn-glycerol-3-phosphate acyltransferase [Anaerolineae bacterium]|nr:1-acyl-sn-glycerol-3-phosphate acyltransferase [Anaerolineae bacterium]